MAADLSITGSIVTLQSDPQGSEIRVTDIDLGLTPAVLQIVTYSPAGNWSTALLKSSVKSLTFIGGSGRDTLDGGGGEDIAIGGSLRFANNYEAVHALWREWTSEH